MNIVWSFVKTIFGHEYIWKWFQPLLSSITVQWQGQCVSRVDGRAGHFFFSQEIYVSVSKRVEKREWIFLRLVLYDLFQTLIYRRMSQCLASWNYLRKNLSFLSQIMFKLQPDSSEMENHHKWKRVFWKWR